MKKILTNGTLGKVDKLVSELRAISHWDADYQRHRCPEWHETVAYVFRQKRRGAIIRQRLRFSASRQGDLRYNSLRAAPHQEPQS